MIGHMTVMRIIGRRYMVVYRSLVLSHERSEWLTELASDSVCQR